MNIKDIQKQAYKMACDKGHYDEDISVFHVMELVHIELSEFSSHWKKTGLYDWFEIADVFIILLGWFDHMDVFKFKYDTLKEYKNECVEHFPFKETSILEFINYIRIFLTCFSDQYGCCDHLDWSELIYCLEYLVGFCEYHQVDLEKYIIEKMEINKGRPYRNGDVN